MKSIFIKVLVKKERAATKDIQSKRKILLLPCSSRYLSSRLLGKFVGNVNDDLWLRVLIAVTMFLVVIKSYRKNFLLDLLQGWFCLGEIFCSSNVEIFVMKRGGQRDFHEFGEF